MSVKDRRRCCRHRRRCGRCRCRRCQRCRRRRRCRRRHCRFSRITFFPFNWSLSLVLFSKRTCLWLDLLAMLTPGDGTKNRRQQFERHNWSVSDRVPQSRSFKATILMFKPFVKALLAKLNAPDKIFQYD